MKTELRNQKNISIYILFAAAILIMFAGCDPPEDPMLNSVRAAHGDTDWHIDTAEEFLYGTDMAGNPMATYHCPDDWSRYHIHVGETNTNSYYHDSDVVASGLDTHVSDGIDKTMLFFYAGHGHPEHFHTLGNVASQDNMLLGNNAGDANNGLLRYYWQCSCEVFAHGPQDPADCTSTSSVFDYSCPGDWDGSADSEAMRNVYERWGDALDPELRMACGSSTSAWCWDSETNRIWKNYLDNSFDVADSFIWGLYRNANNVPLCMTRGGLNVALTPLVTDESFTNLPNEVGDGPYIHMQYLSHFEKNPPWLFFIEFEIPELIPLFELEPMPFPDPWKEYQFDMKDNFYVSTEHMLKRGPMMKVNPNSGAAYLLGPRHIELTKEHSEAEYLESALNFIEKQGWSEDDASKPSGSFMRLQSASQKEGDIRNALKNVIVEVKRKIPVKNGNVELQIPVLGDGGTMEIQMNNDGSVINASKVWRRIKNRDNPKMVNTKPYETAYKEAVEMLKEPDAYRLDRWTFGYKEAAGKVEQKELDVVYQFDFIPAFPERSEDFPPRAIEVSGISGR
jgi:hypothetical protein